jgi:hypothetical protein
VCQQDYYLCTLGLAKLGREQRRSLGKGKNICNSYAMETKITRCGTVSKPARIKQNMFSEDYNQCKKPDQITQRL